MTDHRTSASVLAAAGLAAVVLTACSSGGQPSTAPGSTAPPPSTTVMAGGDKHTIMTKVECRRSTAQADATPAESGGVTTHISVQDDAASVTLALSDEKPPSVDGFGLSLTVGSGQYRLPYQAPQSATQVQAAKDGQGYTVTGTGQGVSPNQGDVHSVTFGIHVTCP